ncbi:MAG: MFS transporter [Aliidongia sp.]
MANGPLAGTYVAESWPEDRRKMGAGYLQTGYYFGFFVAAALNFTVGATYGWRAMFLCGLAPVAVSLITLFKVHEPDKWEHAHEPRSRFESETTQPAGGDFPATLSQPDTGDVGAADRRHHRAMGRRGL